MKTNIKLLAACALMSTAAAVSAQNTNSGYFLDGYTYRYQLNPAYGNDMNFVSIPAIGNINMAMRGNLHLTDVLHVVDGKTVLFTNPNVPNSVLKDFDDMNKLGMDMKLNILSGGFRAWGGYNTVSINARADMMLGMPKSLFSLAKQGVENRKYDLSGLGATANAYAEIAFNHSREIEQVPGLRAGAAVKFLIGLASFDAKTKNSSLTLGQDEWIARTNAVVNANIGKFRFKTKLNDDGHEYVDGADMQGDGSISPNGFGMAFDLGANYKWNDFNFSLAVLDLGWVSYFKTLQASTNGTRTFNTDAYIFNANEDADNSFKHEWDRFNDGLDQLYQLSDNGDVGTRSVATHATLNIGVDYALPMYRKLHFGVLSSSRFISDYSWTEVRISANVNPVKWFGASVNYAVGTFGSSFGWLLNFNPKGFNLFVGMDNTMFKMAKQGVPLNSNMAVNFGINIPFGKRF